MKFSTIFSSILLLVIQTLLVSSPIWAQTPDGCDSSVLIKATDRYEIGLFEESMGELRNCLPDGFDNGEERVSAYRLLALNYVVTDSLEKAQESIRQLLRTDSGYEPDPDNDPPVFAEMIRAQQPPWYTFMWRGSSASRWAGRVAVVGTAVAVPFLLQDNTEPPLPGPPALPD